MFKKNRRLKQQHYRSTRNLRLRQYWSFKIPDMAGGLYH